MRSSTNAPAASAEFLCKRWGIQPGDRVAVLAHSSSDYVEMLYGGGKIGTIMVCLNWRLALPELTGIVADAEPDFRPIAGPHEV